MAQQKVVLVTGGMVGLGETILTRTVDAGYRVVVTYSPGNKAHGAWVSGMKDKGYDILAVACDVADNGACVKAVAEVQAKVGAVDILGSNAGITHDTTFKKMDTVNWDAVLRTKRDSLFNMTKQVADGMVERGRGRIINVSSVNGSKGAFGQTNYSAAKAGVHGLTEALALETAKQSVTVNTISPSHIDTKMVTAIPKDAHQDPAAHSGRAARQARGSRRVIIYLASEEATFVTDANVATNGGRYMQ